MNEKKTSLLSVVMPVYNGEKYLAEAIASVLAQTYSHFEFIIVNDGSNDQSEAIIQAYQKDETRIQYIHLPNNIGISHALNEGVKTARGDYVVRMDCDDLITPDKFFKQLEYFQKHSSEIDILGTYFCLFYPGAGNTCQTVPAYVYDVYNGKPPVHHPTCMIKRQTFINFGYYNSAYDDAEDVELWFRWYAQGVRFANLPESLYKKRIHERSVSIFKMKHQMYLLLKININAIIKYHLRFTVKGYLRILEQVFYLLYLFLRLDRIYVRDKTMYHIKRKAEYEQ